MARIYVYRCNACLHEYEISQAITDKPISKCPSCKKKKCERLICEPLLVSTGDPKTLGTLAEQNTKKLGTYELEAMRENDKKSNTAASETLNGHKRLKATDTPWYRKANSTPAKKIQSMDKQQQQKFIFEGKS